VVKIVEFDFAALVITPDDMTKSRGRKQQAPRDNVLLELGLCIGVLGRERTMVVYDRSADIKIPSDLAGVTLAGYQPHTSGNLEASLGAPSTQIEKIVMKLGLRKPPAPEPGGNELSQDSAADVPDQLFSEGKKRILRALFDEPAGRQIAHYVQHYRRPLEELQETGFVTQQSNIYTLTNLGNSTTAMYLRSVMTRLGRPAR
jgi:hypothetical protein